jgi:hypothetical protein
MVPSYSFGTSLLDGTSVVLGQACDSAACQSLILQQDAFSADWQRVSVPDGMGVPAGQPPNQKDCGAGRFKLAGASGESRQDFYVWGDWTRCVPGTTRLFYECPPQWPCIWHIEDGAIEPVNDLRGRVMRGVRVMGGVAFALAEDGTLWRRVADRWRLMDQVPHMHDRQVAASTSVVVRKRGDRLSYEPGAGDTISGFFVAQLHSDDMLNGGGVRAFTVRDSVIAMVMYDGSVFRSSCAFTREAVGAGAASLACETPIRLSGPSTISAIGLLDDGEVMGVGPQRVVRWRGALPFRDDLPASALRDSLWGVSVAADGTATVVGKHSLLQRDAAGLWTVLRSFPDGAANGDHFAVLPNGQVAMASGWLRLWDRTTETPLAVLRQAELGAGTIDALHALPDGRLVAGFGNRDAPGVGGWIEVWAAPVHEGRSQRVELPLNVDVTSLANDGTRLIVAGRGGTMAIPLRSLPFHVSS